MPDLGQLKNIVEQQKQILAQLEQEANAIINADLTKENAALKKELEETRKLLTEHSEKLRAAKEQNDSIKNALFEQIYSEKTRILDNSSKKNDIYFRSAADGELNRLKNLEQVLQNRVLNLQYQLKKYDNDTFAELFIKLEELTKQAGAALVQARADTAAAYGAYSSHSKEQFETLKNEQITDEMVEVIGKKNNLEAFVGGNLINKAGILFLILGIIAVSQLTFFQLSETFRGIIMFAISGAFLLFGEILNKKKASIFSLGVTSVGVAGLYASLSISYFMFEILAMIPALLLCILITAGAFVLSLRYSSQTIAAFALIGGYIPIISISDSILLIYSAMVYFIVLNLLALMLSFYKNWKISMFIGFFLNLCSTFYIVFNVFWRGSAIFQTLILIAYISLAFAVYTCIPLISAYRSKLPLKRADVVILALNTVLSALIMYGTLLMLDLAAYTGIMAIAFAVIYIALGRLMEVLYSNEKHVTNIFYLTGLTFVVLVVPMQFGTVWLSLGWLVQAVSLACYGILTGEKRFKRAGFVIGAICLASFIFFDVVFAVLRIDSLFSYKYLAITLGSLAVLAALAYKKSLHYIGENIYKYLVLCNAWFYSIYLVNLCYGFVETQMRGTPFEPEFLINSMAIAVTFLFVAVLPRVPLIADRGVKILTVCISIIGLLALFGTTSAFSLIKGDVTIGVMMLATIVLLALCALAIITMRNVLMFFVLETGLPASWLPFGVSAYFLTVLTQNLVAQYNLAFTSMVISIIFVIAALAWIIYGFVRMFAFMRRFGLALSVVAVAKLFLVDLYSLTQGHRIISYFAFGITLLGISFVYQYFSKRLTPKIKEGE